MYAILNKFIPYHFHLKHLKPPFIKFQIVLRLPAKLYVWIKFKFFNFNPYLASGIIEFMLNKNNFLKFLTAALVLILLLNSCKQETHRTYQKPDILVANMDTSVIPGEDIFSFANGTWIKNNPIPPEESRWGIANLVVNENYTRLRIICEEAASGTHSDHNAKMIGDFWTMAMDSLRADELGTKPLKPLLGRIDTIQSVPQLLKMIAEFHMLGSEPAFSLYATQDLKKSDQMALYLNQGGLGLPNRDYYFNTDTRTSTIRKEYPHHISVMLQLLGRTQEQSIRDAEQILSLETALAKSSRKLEDLRDPHANYNPYSITKFKMLTPGINWTEWLETAEIKVDSCIVGQPEFFKTLNGLLTTLPLDHWRAYLRWNLINTFAHTLSKEINDQNFLFYGKLMSGAEVQKPRWKRALNEVENSIGELLGREFVKEYFSPQAKKRYENMVEEVKTSFAEHIRNLEWMSQETKAKALTKLQSMNKKVGYPDQWKDFSTMQIAKNSYCENVMNAKKWWYSQQIKKLYKPVDRTEWDMTPQTYNAYYNPSNNEIVLPAAIFTVPGYRDEELDDALVYGYAGASTIGHEITHGFDDEGRKFDEFGNLNNWWSTEDEERFNEHAQKMINQFNDYTVLDSLHINGKATLGENIADLGGIVLALDAFKKTAQYKSNQSLNGLLPIQRYFLGYALGWLGHTRPEEIASRVLTDVHSPTHLRVIGPFTNIPEFYDAFQIKEGMKMWRPDSVRVNIW